MIQKIINIKTLKKIKIELKYIENNDILDIKNYNTSIIKMFIFWRNKNKDCILYNLQDRLPNLSDLNIYYDCFFNDIKPNIEIRENKNCKINKFIYF